MKVKIATLIDVMNIHIATDHYLNETMARLAVEALDNALKQLRVLEKLGEGGGCIRCARGEFEPEPHHHECPVGLALMETT